MRLTDADKLEENYKKLIDDAHKERSKYDPDKDRQDWVMWTAVLADRYAYLVDVIQAKTKNDDLQTYWVRLKGDDYACVSCGWIVPDLTSGYKHCPGCGKLIDRSKTR